MKEWSHSGLARTLEDFHLVGESSLEWMRISLPWPWPRAAAQPNHECCASHESYDSGHHVLVCI